MPEPQAQERTEKATPKKRNESRKRGQVLRSREVNSVAILFAGLGIFFFLGERMFLNMIDWMKGYFSSKLWMPIDNIFVHQLLSETFTHHTINVAPLFLGVAFAGLAANIAQVGFLIIKEPFKLDITRLNPVSGLKRLFSLRAFVEISKSIIKISLIGGVSWLIFRWELRHIPGLIHISAKQLLPFFISMLVNLVFFTCLLLILLAAADYMYQKWQYERDLRMTKEEIKEENRQREGDPRIKSRIRSVQLSMARQRMMAMVPEAAVVVTNPARLAIALKFEPSEMSAPQVVAKGAGYVAQKIRETAESHNIPIVEDVPLARTLFQNVDLGAFIPVELYRAVAEILAYVYRLKGLVTTQ